jgi:hypothetical protein
MGQITSKHTITFQKVNGMGTGEKFSFKYKYNKRTFNVKDITMTVDKLMEKNIQNTTMGITLYENDVKIGYIDEIDLMTINPNRKIRLRGIGKLIITSMIMFS